MKTYRNFHGNIHLTMIGKELRRIVSVENKHFKILTGHGASNGTSRSKDVALDELYDMEEKGLIKGYFPGEVKNELLGLDSEFYEYKMNFSKLVSKDSDYGNPGIIFIFV